MTSQQVIDYLTQQVKDAGYTPDYLDLRDIENLVMGRPMQVEFKLIDGNLTIIVPKNELAIERSPKQKWDDKKCIPRWLWNFIGSTKKGRWLQRLLLTIVCRAPYRLTGQLCDSIFWGD